MQGKPATNDKSQQVMRDHANARPHLDGFDDPRFTRAIEATSSLTLTFVENQSGSSQLSLQELEERQGDHARRPQQEPRQILLVDDDPMFGAILKRCGAKDGLSITVCSTVDSLGRYMDRPFDLAIVDYDLGSVTGIEIVHYLANRDWQAPFLLISQSNLPNSAAQTGCNWPFVHKARGPQAIIDVVLQTPEFDQGSKRRQVASSSP